MRRRSKAGGEPAKAPRRKTGARKSRVTPKAARGRSSSIAGLEAKVARLTRERDESLEQQTATSVRRSSAGVCDDASKCRPHMRRQVWQYLPLGRRGLALPRNEYATCLC